MRRNRGAPRAAWHCGSLFLRDLARLYCLGSLAVHPGAKVTHVLAVVFPGRSAYRKLTQDVVGIQIDCRCKNKAGRQREMVRCVSLKDIGLFDASSSLVPIQVRARKLAFMSVRLSG